MRSMGLLDRLRRLVGPADPPPAEAPTPKVVITVERSTGPYHRPMPSEERQYLSAEEAAELLVPGDDGQLPVRIRDGFFQHVPTGRRVTAANRTLNAHGLISFKVRGNAYYQSKAADTRPGKPAILVRDPDNKHDPNAVAVYAEGRPGERLQVGHVNRGLARRLAKRLDSGETISAWFMRGDPPGRDSEGVPCVVLTDEDGIARLLGP